MAYSELVKNLDHIRGYMRDFYVYGFKSRDDFESGAGKKRSLRSYDDERRRIESWLGDYMGFRRTTEGKTAFISINSRGVEHNPLYKAWKTKSFTNGEITLHFILLDILQNAEMPLSLSEITDKIDANYLQFFKTPLVFDESTVRKKLKEYAEEGIVILDKEGKRTVFSLAIDTVELPNREMLDFFSEVLPVGVVGSFLLDKGESQTDCFVFKHHYITSALDSEILCLLLHAMSQKAYVEVQTVARKRAMPKKEKLVPIQVFISLQNGRQHLMAWNNHEQRIKSYRLDYLMSVTVLEQCVSFDGYREMLDKKKPHMWGVMCRKNDTALEHIEMTIRAEEGEEHIYSRLLREKRCGTVEQLDAHTYRFSADVFDTNEMVPWIRTFICRIVDIKMANRLVEEKLKQDIHTMYKMYGIGGETDAVQ